MAKKKAPTKECPECHAQVHARTRTCECGHVFELKAKQKDASGTSPTLSSFVQVLSQFEEWGETYQTWDEARQAMKSILDLVELSGGEKEAFAILAYLAKRDAK